QLVLEAGGIGRTGEILVFDMGKPIKILDLARQMIRLSGLLPEEDIKIQFTGLRPGEKLYEELLADKENTTKTINEKILLGKATCDFEEDHLIRLCENLTKAIRTYDNNESVKILKKLVPEYRLENTDPPKELRVF